MEDYDQFKKKILALTSLDLDIYRQPQLQRRLQSLLKKNGMSTFDAYFQLLLDNPQARFNFKSDITINQYLRQSGWDVRRLNSV